MCSGSTRHLINGSEVLLGTGELLFLSQTATQEIFPAGYDDIAVNFIILPEFFGQPLDMIGTEDNMLRTFIIECLKNGSQNVHYLHFKVADILPIQNLVENLIWTLHNKQPNKRSSNQVTMGLLFLQLMNYIDKAELDGRIMNRNCCSLSFSISRNITAMGNCLSLHRNWAMTSTGSAVSSSAIQEKITRTCSRKSG